MTVQKTKTTSIIASFATLKSLLDANKYQSPYQILREFISHIILSNSLYSFSTVEMKNYLASHFCFSIPEAVIKTALKKIPGITLEKDMYKVSGGKISITNQFEKTKKESDEYESRIIQLLSEYISNKTGNDTINKEILSQELICFLVEDEGSYIPKYSELIGEFILKNEQNKEIQDGLNKIREGSILYIGLSYGIGETGSITKPLVLYLGTEILFSLVGYNGEIFQQLANDFFTQVRTANSKSKMITLHYFSETKTEIDDFFCIAKQIVDGKRYFFSNKTAMKSITDGCQTSTDVDVKQSDFYYKLRNFFKITEDPCDNYYDEKYFVSNLESFDYDDETDKKNKRETAIKLISHINKLRDGKSFGNDFESEHLIVTNTKATLLISNELSNNIKQNEKLDNICNFAISLNRITNLLWYKLGNGFSKSEFPSSVNAILKARIVLSADIAKNAEREFIKLKSEYKNGVVNDDQVSARIIVLKNKPVFPEDIQRDDIDDIMNFTPEFLSRYEEQMKNDQKALKEKDEMLAVQANTIKKTSEENTFLSEELNKYQQKEKDDLRKKEQRRNIFRFIWSIIWKLGLLVILFLLTSLLDKNNSKTLSTISDLINLLGIISTGLLILKKDIKIFKRTSKK